MFSRLCKNAIFPLSQNSGGGGGAGGQHGQGNQQQSQSINTADTVHSVRRPIRSAGSQAAVAVNRSGASNDTESGIAAEVLRREPPPPYWVHHHHRRPSPPPIRAATAAAAPAEGGHPAAAVQRRSPVLRPTEESDSDNEQQYRDPNLLDKRIFCPDLLFTCTPASSPSTADNSSLAVSSHRVPPPVSDTDDENYVRIDDIRQRFAVAATVTAAYNNEPINVSAALEDEPPPAIPPRSNRHAALRTYAAPALAGDQQVVAEPEQQQHQQHHQQQQDMGQSLSQRRPRLSLTWVLRDQQQHQQQQQQQQQPNNAALPDGGNQPATEQSVTTTVTTEANDATTAAVPTTTLEKKLRFRSKSKDCVERLFSEKYVTAGQCAPPSVVVVGGGGEVAEQQQQQQSQPAPLNTAGGRLMFVCSKTRDVTSCLGYDSDYGECSGGGNPAASSTTARRSVRMRAKSVVKRAASKLSFRDNLNNNSLTEKTIVCEKMVVMSSVNGGGVVLDGKPVSVLGMKSTYSEPALSVGAADTVIGQSRRHRHRRRRERNRSQRFGYEIRNVDEFLSKCSLSSPGNIPVVLSATSTLYQTRPGGYQIEIPLPLGMVVNAVFKNQNWLYVQTPHAEEGYVGYATCLPLGILPQSRPTPSSKPPPCWESNGDVFPKPCGNMTDSEKEIHMRGGTRSEGTRTPRLRRTGTTVTTTSTAATVTGCAANNNNQMMTATAAAAAVQHLPALVAQQTPVVVAQQSLMTTASAAGAPSSASCGERHLDVLYLRAAAAASQQPKPMVEKMYAQLKPKNNGSSGGKCHPIATAVKSNSIYQTIGSPATATSSQHHHHHYQQMLMARSNCSAIVKPQAVVLTSADDYVLLQNHHQIQQQQQQIQQQQQQQQQLHQLSHQHQSSQPIYQSAAGSVVSAGNFSTGAASTHIAGGGNKCLLRQTLLAITDNYMSGTIAVHKGDVVTLLACRQVIDPRIAQPVQWFFVRARDGTQGYIPAEVAGHGFL